MAMQITMQNQTLIQIPINFNFVATLGELFKLANWKIGREFPLTKFWLMLIRVANGHTLGEGVRV